MTPDELDVAIAELENRLERLRALYEQYFMGIERIEPQVVRKDVDRRFWLLRKEKVRNTAKRFKLQTLVQRYNTLQQYWGRICREIELGTYKRHKLRAERTFGSLDAAQSTSVPPEAAEPGGEEAPLDPRAQAAQRASNAVRSAEDDLRELMSGDFDPGAELDAALDALMGPSKPAAAKPAAKAEAKPTAPAEAAPSAPRKGGLLAQLGTKAGPAPSSTSTPGSSPVSSTPVSSTPVSSTPATSSAQSSAAARSGPGAAAPSSANRSAPTPSKAPPPPRPSLPSAPASAASRPPLPPPRSAPPAPSNKAALPKPSGVPSSVPRPSSAPRPSSVPRPNTASRPSSVPRPGPASSRPSSVPRPTPRTGAPATPQIPGAPKLPATSPTNAAAARAAAAQARPTESAARPPAATSGSGLDEARLRELHQRYQAAREQTKTGGPVSLEKLAQNLRETEAKLRAQHQGRKVDFDIVIKDGKAVIKPKLT